VIRDDIVVMTGGAEPRIVFWLGGPAIGRSQEGERARMATWMEAPIEASEVDGRGEIGVLPDGPPSEIDPWIVLDAAIWPGANVPEREAIATPAQPWSGPLEHEDPTPPIHEVIAAWRAADRELAGLVEGDPDWNRIHAELVGLRALHHRLFDARMARDPAGGESSSRWTFAIMAWGPAPLPAGVMA
jgi:hypothetical protein